MSEADFLDEAAPPRPKRNRRRLRWLVGGLLVAGAVAGALLFLIDPSELELQAAVAEADRLDPSWRLEELQARREVIPDEENAALCVLAARRRMARGTWPFVSSRPRAGRVAQTLSHLPPPVQLTDAAAGDMKAELADLEAALAEARTLKALSRGRYPVAWGESMGGIRVDMETLNAVRELLLWEAAAQAQEGRPGEALATARAALVVARSVGDEPRLDSLVARQFAQLRVVRGIERTLAQGTAAPEDLRATQALLQDEAAQPLLLNALRGQRAATFRATRADRGGVNGGSAVVRLREMVGRPIRARQLRSEQAKVLRKATECVEIAKLPVDDQRQPLTRARVARPDGHDDLSRSLWYLTGSVEDNRHYQALLRCAVTGLALERHRHDTGRWPERLDELAPAYLKAVPLNPFDAKPLGYKRLPDGVVVYAVTAEGAGHFGFFEVPRGGGGRETEHAFRLWDVDRRRQPPAEVLPMPNPAK